MWLRLPVALATSFWVGISVVAIAAGVAFPLQTWVSLSFFVALFVGVGLYYWTMHIVVDDYAVTYRGLLAFRTYAFEEILEIRITPVPGMTSYDVRTKWDGLCFTSLIAGHRDLVDLIVSRAHLQRGVRSR